jgi:hypothetical protein
MKSIEVFVGTKYAGFFVQFFLPNAIFVWGKSDRKQRYI